MGDSSDFSSPKKGGNKADVSQMSSFLRLRAWFVLKSAVPAQLPGPQRKEEQ